MSTKYRNKMNAKEAREKALKLKEDQKSSDLLEVLKRIEHHVSKSKLEFCYYKPISKEAIKELKSKGYIVKHESGRNEDWIRISW